VSYQVIARKWRPQRFDDVTGQAHVTTALRNAIRTGRVPHAVLLAGPRGVGKTTIARILACCLNCEKGPTDTPDPDDAACREIAAGTSTDVREIDAASRTGVDDVRELIEAVRYAPTPGKHRIFIVDEVHMLSVAAFNALLKTLEEPPPRSLFVFCTTNPEKIPFTVVSRCQRYDLKRIASAEIVARLGEIARAEGISISEASLRAVAREGDGSMRDAQTLLDQIVAFGGTRVEDSAVAEVLDLIDRRVLLAIARACIASDPAAALEACARALDGSADPRRLGASLVQLLRDLVVVSLAPDRPQLVDASDAELAELSELAARAEPARLRRMFRALVKEQEDLAWAPQPGAVIEMALVRLATLPAGDDVAQLLARLDALERRLAGGGNGDAGPAPDDAGSGGTRSAATRPPRSGGPRGSRAEAPVAAPPAAGASAVSAGAGTDSAPAAPDPGAALDRLRAFVAEEHRGLGAALEGGRLLECGERRVRIAVPRAFDAGRLRGKLDVVARACERLFGRRLAVEIQCEEDGVDEREAAGRRREDARQRRQRALEHPAVNAALEVLEGEIVDIRPLGSQGP
jgi:DNA polymerase-3 subunit gamma/tau